MASENVITLTNDNYELEVEKSDIPVLVDFWAAWCGPCRMVAPIIDELADDYKGRIKVAKLNVDEQGEIAAKFRIMSIPTVILFKDGQIAEKLIGARDKTEFAEVLDKHI